VTRRGGGPREGRRGPGAARRPSARQAHGDRGRTQRLLLPVNHAARAYFARNQRVEPGSPTRYIEVTNGQHFDAFMSYGPALGYDTRFIPLHVYFNAAMDAVWAHLTTGAPLPVSQVVHTVPRASSSTPLSSVNVPPISAAPARAQIVFDGRTLVVPD
jgi:hydroxybutyrate-dimer hydrolase